MRTQTFHLATQKNKENQAKTEEVVKVLLDNIRNHTKDLFKYLTKNRANCYRKVCEYILILIQ